MVGLIGTAHGVAGVLSNFVFGRLGDRMDRRGLLLFGFALSSLAYLGQYFAADPLSLLGARFFVGFASGIIPATLVAYVYDVKRPLGKFSSYNALGWLVGSTLIILAGWLPTLVFRSAAIEALRAGLERVGSFGVLFIASALFCAAGWFVARRLPSMHVHIDVPLFPARIIARNASVYLSIFLRHLGATAIWAIYPIYILSIGGDLALVGWLHVLNMIAQILVFRTAERSRRLGHPRALITLGLVLSASVFAAFALVHNAYQLLPLQLVVGVSFASLWLGSLKEVLAHNVERSTASGLLNASMSLSNVAGPLLGGLIAHHYGFHATMFAGSAVTVFALALYLIIDRPRTPAPEIAATAPRLSGDVAP